MSNMSNKSNKSNKALSFENILEVEGINARGFGTIAKLVMLDQRLTIEAKAIYSYFCSYAGNGTTAFPSVEKIYHDLKIGKDRYYKHFKKLVACGYITVRQNRQEGNKFDNNIYTLVANPVAKTPCPDFKDTGNISKKPCPDFKDTENMDTNINSNNINKNLNNNNNNKATANAVTIFNNAELDSIVNTFTDEVKTVIQAFKDSTSVKIVPSVLNALNKLVDQHGYEFVYHAITRANKDININYLKKVLNSSSYVGKKTVEEVEKAIAEYNAPSTTNTSKTSKTTNKAPKTRRTKATKTTRVIRTELVPDWLNETSQEPQETPTTPTAPTTPTTPTTQEQSKTLDNIINEYQHAPYEVIMSKVEQHGFNRYDINIINKVMASLGYECLM